MMELLRERFCDMEERSWLCRRARGGGGGVRLVDGEGESDRDREVTFCVITGAEVSLCFCSSSGIGSGLAESGGGGRGLLRSELVLDKEAEFADRFVCIGEGEEKDALKSEKDTV